jgi:hypothetical protein
LSAPVYLKDLKRSVDPDPKVTAAPQPSFARMPVSGEVEAFLTDATAAAAAELFAEYHVLLAAGDESAYRSAGDLAFLSVVSYMAAGVSGTQVLGATPSVLRRSNPCATSDRDWTGELANQLFGRVKLKLLRRGLEMWSASPAVVDGRHLVPVLSQPGFQPSFFTANRGECVAVWTELEVKGGVALLPETAAPTGEIPAEGDLILF